MTQIILVCGLPGSGKTTLANKIFQKLENSIVLNGDMLRNKFNDWDFSELGRERQAKRMKEYALKSKKQWVILDFVCPKEKFRKARRGYALLESVIMDGIKEGLMELDKPMIAAYTIWAQLHGVVSVVFNQRLDSRIDRDEFIEESVEQIMQGFLIRITTT